METTISFNNPCVCYIPGFGIPTEIQAEPKNPHCLHVSWKKAAGPVTGYRIYCFVAESVKTEIIKDIHDINQQSVIISGFKPETLYKVGIASVSGVTQSPIQFSKNDVKLRE